MNLKKLFGRFNPDESEEEVRVRRLVESLPKKRQQHYLFAHRFLPSAAHQMGAISVLLLGDSDNADAFLREVWDDCGKDLSGYDLVAPDGLRATVTQIGDKLLAIVTLPRPEAVPEAHFVGILSDLTPDMDEADSEVFESRDAREVLRLLLRSMPIRYFTLEKGVMLDASERTVFCEWTSDGSHINMGDGPQPTEQAFIEFVSAQNFSLALVEDDK